MFGITLSTILTADDIAAAFSRLIPPGLKIDVFPESDTPEEVGAIWAYLGKTNDPAWPCMVDVIYGDECELGDYPDLRVAEYLHKCFGCNVLCGTYPFVGDLDPHNPFWALAYVNGQWYFADTCESPLWGFDLVGEEEEDIRVTDKVQLIRPIAVPNVWAK